MPQPEIDLSRLEAAAAAEQATEKEKLQAEHREQAEAAETGGNVFYEITPGRRLEAAREMALFVDKRARILTKKYGENVPPGAVDSRMAAAALAISMGWWLHTLSRAELEQHILAFNQAVRLHYVQWRHEDHQQDPR